MGGRIVSECGWGVGEGGLERWVSFRMIWRQVTSPVPIWRAYRMAGFFLVSRLTLEFWLALSVTDRMPEAFDTLSLHSRYAFAKFSNLQFLILIPSFHEHLQQTSIFFKTTNFLSCPLFPRFQYIIHKPSSRASSRARSYSRDARSQSFDFRQQSLRKSILLFLQSRLFPTLGFLP